MRPWTTQSELRRPSALADAKFMKYHALGAVLAADLILLGVLHLATNAEREHREVEMEDKKALVQRLGLTDMALWSEARYTRHPSQADWFASFQDFPSSIEHFPAGVIIGPPLTLRSPASRIEENKQQP